MNESKDFLRTKVEEDLKVPQPSQKRDGESVRVFQPNLNSKKIKK